MLLTISLCMYSMYRIILVSIIHDCMCTMWITSTWLSLCSGTHDLQQQGYVCVTFSFCLAAGLNKIYSTDFHETWWRGAEWAKEEPIIFWSHSKSQDGCRHISSGSAVPWQRCISRENWQRKQDFQAKVWHQAVEMHVLRVLSSCIAVATTNVSYFPLHFWCLQFPTINKSVSFQGWNCFIFSPAQEKHRLTSEESVWITQVKEKPQSLCTSAERGRGWRQSPSAFIKHSFSGSLCWGAASHCAAGVSVTRGRIKSA